jgi:PadR family transcriptional regulator PadR
MHMDVTGWQTQLRKGAAELVVLSLLKEQERYGLDILRHASGNTGVLSDGTLYPLLTRLEREGKIIGRWALEDESRNPRKYYHLSAEGAALLVEMTRVWGDFAVFVSSFTDANDGDSEPRRRNLSRKAG